MSISISSPRLGARSYSYPHSKSIYFLILTLCFEKDCMFDRDISCNSASKNVNFLMLRRCSSHVRSFLMRGGRKLNYFNLHRFEYSQKPGLSRTVNSRFSACALTIFFQNSWFSIYLYYLIPKIIWIEILEIFTYSRVSNKRAANLIIFWKILISSNF